MVKEYCIKLILARYQKQKTPAEADVEYERYLHLNICFAFEGFCGWFFLFEKL